MILPIAHGKAASAAGGGDFTSGDLDTTGANFIAIGLSWKDGTAEPVVTDSKLNTYDTSLTAQTDGATFNKIKWVFAKGATCGSGHNWTVTGGTFKAINILAFSSTYALSPFDAQNGAKDSGFTHQPGQVSPVENGELIVAIVGISSFFTETYTINSGFQITDHQAPVSGANFSIAAAYLIQRAKSPVNPRWTSDGSFNHIGCIACFKAPPVVTTGNFFSQFILPANTQPLPKKPRASVIFSGELYALETAQDFLDGGIFTSLNSYDSRKRTFAQNPEASGWIREPLKTNWPKISNIGYGVFVDNWLPTSIARATSVLTNAANQADSLYWTYGEAQANFLITSPVTVGPITVQPASSNFISAVQAVTDAHPTKLHIYDGQYMPDDTLQPSPGRLAAIPTILATLPFNGVLVHVKDAAENTAGLTDATYRLISSDTTITLAVLRDLLAPLLTANLGNATHNYAAGLMALMKGNSILGLTEIDPFDDISGLLNNIGYFTKAIREVGLAGIWLDNENYSFPNPGWGSYRGKKYNPAKTLEEYQDQMYWFGQQVMNTMISEYPDIEVVIPTGPEQSVLAAMNVPPGNDSYTDNELNGPFSAGMLAAGRPLSNALLSSVTIDYLNGGSVDVDYQNQGELTLELIR